MVNVFQFAWARARLAIGLGGRSAAPIPIPPALVLALICAVCACSSGGDTQPRSKLKSQQSALCSAPTLTTSKTAVALGSSVTLTATANCAVGDSPQYRFEYAVDGSTTYQVIRDWNAAASATWTPTGIQVGKYTIRVLVRGGGTGSGDSNKAATLWVGNYCTQITGSASSVNEPPPIGQPVTVTGLATCSGGTPQYKFLYRTQSETTWTTLKDWSTDATAQLNTSSLVSGMYSFAVQARAGQAAADSTTSFDFPIGKSCKDVTLAGAPVSPTPLTQPITFSATSTCAAQTTPEYQFLFRKDGGATWQTIRPFGASATLTWDPRTATYQGAPITPGLYNFAVYVRGSGNTISKWEAWKPLNYKLGVICKSATLAFNPVNAPTLGTPVTVSATADCEGAAAQYRFHYRPQHGSYIAIDPADAWRDQPSITWNTSGLPSARYELMVQVRVKANNSAPEAQGLASYYLGDVCAGVTMSVSSPSPQPVGSSIRLNATATCRGTSLPEYAFTYLSPSGREVVLNQWSPASSATFDTRALPPGVYQLRVYTRRSTNPSVYESSASANYTLIVPSACSSTDAGVPPDADGDGIPNACDPCDNRTDSDGDGLSNCVEQYDSSSWTDPNLFNGITSARGAPCNLQCETGLTQASVSQCLNTSTPTQRQRLSSGWRWSDAYSTTSCAPEFGFTPNWNQCPANWYIANGADLSTGLAGYHCFKLSGVANECGALYFDGQAVNIGAQAVCVMKPAGSFPVSWFVQPAAGARVTLAIDYCFGGSTQCNPAQPLPQELLRAGQVTCDPNTPGCSLDQCADQVLPPVQGTGRAAEAAYQAAIARSCSMPGESTCIATLVGRANADYTAAALKIINRQFTPAQYLAAIRHRLEKVREAESDTARATKLCDQPDADGDWVVDAEDQCASTPDLVAVDARGCPLTTLPAAPSASDVRKALENSGMVFNPACQDARVPPKIPAGAFYRPANAAAGTYILAGRVKNQPANCPVWYQFDIEERSFQGVVQRNYSVVFQDREQLTALVGTPAPVPSSFIQFNPLPGHAGTRGQLGSVGGRVKVRFRVRAMNGNGVRGGWSPWKLTDCDDCHYLGFRCVHTTDGVNYQQCPE